MTLYASAKCVIFWVAYYKQYIICPFRILVFLVNQQYEEISTNYYYYYYLIVDIFAMVLVVRVVSVVLFGKIYRTSLFDILYILHTNFVFLFYQVGGS